MNTLKDKSIIITGAAMGLGLAVAEECARQGAKLTLVDYNGDALDKAAEKLRKAFPEIRMLTVVADVSVEEQVKNYVNKTLEAFGRIDGFYNNAGVEGIQNPLTECDLEDFRKVIDINLYGVYYGLRYVIPFMKLQQYGRIVNASSVAGIRAVPDHAPYVASKHAVCGLTKSIAVEYAADGIAANAIAPGAILTPMVEEAFKQMNPEDPALAEKEFAASNPAKRLGIPKEVAGVVCFLLSEGAGYVNGQTIAIDGGQSAAY